MSLCLLLPLTRRKVSGIAKYGTKHTHKSECANALVGNMIEWNYPAGVNLDGVEFNSMVSGAHTIVKDFV